jgi:hypothetical protein
LAGPQHLSISLPNHGIDNAFTLIRNYLLNNVDKIRLNLNSHRCSSLHTYHYQGQKMKKAELISDSYLKLREIMENPVSDIEEFSGIISKDHGIASMVLRMANHEIYGLSGQIHSIDHAINLLGIGQICEIVLEIIQILPFDQMAPAPKSNNVIQFPVKQSWQAATLCA